MSNSVSFIVIFIVALTSHRMRCSARAVTNHDCKRSIDIIFLLDESESVGPVGFNAIKGYTKQILKGLHLSTCDNIGLITFSHYANSQMFYGSRDTMAYVIARIDALEGPSRYVSSEVKESQMNLGLLLAESIFSTQRMERESTEKLLVVITDGYQVQQELTSNEISVENFAQKLTKNGVRIHVLAIGNDTSIPKLLEIAPDERNIFEENDIDDLLTTLLTPNESKEEECERKIGSGSRGSGDESKEDECERKIGSGSRGSGDETKEEECKRKIDIGFVLDSSESIGPIGFKSIKKHVKKILLKLNVSKCDNIGLIKFDEFATSETYFGTHETKGEMFARLDGLEGPDRFVASEVNESNINLGLMVADEILFTKQLGSRQSSQKFLIVMTDGHHTKKQPSTNQAITFDDNFVKRLTKKGVRILVLAVGNDVSIQELLKFTSVEKDIFPEKQLGGLIAALLSKKPPLLRNWESMNIIV